MKEVKDNSIYKYSGLKKMDETKCVKVSKSYFYYLYNRVRLVKNIDKEIYNIFDKYINIDKMYDELYGKDHISYYIMNVSDLREIISVCKERRFNNNTIMRTDINILTLNRKNKELEELYLEKNKSKVKREI